ncbi:hypothetical protein BDA99DRAFT_534314 [Phascolomyces articulosus]|uniref:Uncharacterized protein n=1 Tax=Phascolomyces articulosus TaxID=60185 RepID=A0AAD5K6T2_9FUNG|nr:hypothetical protein BDA99DRAFT_534314 [Phascolomyces articulosus]
MISPYKNYQRFDLGWIGVSVSHGRDFTFDSHLHFFHLLFIVTLIVPYNNLINSAPELLVISCFYPPSPYLHFQYSYPFGYSEDLYTVIPNPNKRFLVAIYSICLSIPKILDRINYEKDSILSIQYMAREHKTNLHVDLLREKEAKRDLFFLSDGQIYSLMISGKVHIETLGDDDVLVSVYRYQDRRPSCNNSKNRVLVFTTEYNIAAVLNWGRSTLSP